MSSRSPSASSRTTRQATATSDAAMLSVAKTPFSSAFVLTIENLHVAIGAANVLRGVNLSVEAGEVRGLVGESGAGKSMVGRAIFGLLPERAKISAGSIRFDGRDLLAMPERERRHLLGRRIALIGGSMFALVSFHQSNRQPA